MRIHPLFGGQRPNKDAAGPAYSSTQPSSTLPWGATLTASSYKNHSFEGCAGCLWLLPFSGLGKGRIGLLGQSPSPEKARYGIYYFIPGFSRGMGGLCENPHRTLMDA